MTVADNRENMAKRVHNPGDVKTGKYDPNLFSHLLHQSTGIEESAWPNKKNWPEHMLLDHRSSADMACAGRTIRERNPHPYPTSCLKLQSSPANSDLFFAVVFGPGAAALAAHVAATAVVIGQIA